MEINSAVLQILDLESGSLFCSQKELDIKAYPVKTYLESVVKKFHQGDLKEGHLSADDSIIQTALNGDLSFVEKSEKFATIFFNCLSQGHEVPSGDLFCMELEDRGDSYLGLFKINYKPAYTHFVDYEEDQLLNNLIINKTILPATSQKVSEGLVINLSTFEFKLVEKKYMFDDKKTNYLTDLILKTAVKPTVQENIKIVKKAVKEVADKYNEETFTSLANVQQAVHESIESEGRISNQKIAEVVFEHNHSAKSDYLEKVEQSRFVEDVPVNVPKYEKKYSKQKLKLTNGIEMFIPVEVYQDKDLIEFINNPDGTISVMIKNVDDIINRF
ncbi:nucleoid-associated protein [Vagococcus coleopterorum]|uniref:Nucleoid-associated protein n=1 Tax=Vagococcus coleopterorum TaxID=2714946 RepID=A0A6G8ANZ2_9ENTE|nr:nucleoid-associated protein [Vagococcus coleopterorum]QIL46662.1 nucleoid-associated protein [Vagococcus coleopterorum]